MNVPIFIASSIDYEPIHLRRIITNIITCSDIPPENVIIVSGGHEKESTEIIDKIKVIRVQYRCFEFTPFIFLTKNPTYIDFEYAFFSHDTVEFGPTFYSKITSFASYMKNHGFTTKKIDRGMSMNIGLYTKSIILDHTKMLDSICLYTNNKETLWKMKHTLIYKEDSILNAGRLYRVSYNPKIISYNTLDTNNKPLTVYKKIYDNIDLIKYQTNYCKIYSIDSAIEIK